MAHEASYYQQRSDGTLRCELCPHGCIIAEGKRGLCRVRENQGGTLVALTYGEVTSVAMDPIEKKPLYHFHPGRSILSVGTWGCNFRCSFCQNYEIAHEEPPTRPLPVADLVELARQRDSVGVAYTYNEPSIWFEYLRDAGTAIKDAGLKNVLVTNGFFNPEPLEELLPRVDAMNIDLKAFHQDFYKTLCGGRLKPVLDTIARAAQQTHVEITTLIIPEHNDAPKELTDMAKWIAAHAGPDTPMHLSAHFPRYKLKADATPEDLLVRCREIFKQHLNHVYLGNVRTAAGANTVCPACAATIIRRSGYSIDTSGMTDEGACAVCGAELGVVIS